MTGTLRDPILIISEAAHNRIGIARDLTRRQWLPVPVATWERACAHGLASAQVVITDAQGLRAVNADLAVFGIIPESAPILVISKTSPPRWARRRVHQLSRADIPSYLEDFRRRHVLLVGSPIR